MSLKTKSKKILRIYRFQDIPEYTENRKSVE